MPVFVFLHHIDESPTQGHRFVELGKQRVHHPLLLLLEYRFPGAPKRPWGAGRLVRLWYTVNTEKQDDGFGVFGEPELVIELVASLKEYIQGIVDQGTPAREIILCGFRQGAVVLAAAIPLLQDVVLGGVVLISGFVPAYETIQGWINTRGGPETLGNRDMPILALHASDDHIDVGLQLRADELFHLCGYRNYSSAETSYLDQAQLHVTDGMWMLVWQFVIQVLGQQS